MLAAPDERAVDWAAAEELALASILADGIADPLHRRGRRARHLQPPPRRAARRRDRASALTPLQRAAAGHGGVRDPQQRAVREGRGRLRAMATTCRSRSGWCCGRRSTATSSTARRPSSTSSCCRGGPSGAWRRRWCCCSRTATRGRGRITPAPGWSGSCSRPPTSTCASPTAPPRRSTSTCCAGRPCSSTTDPLPLVVLTPKSLLRHPLVASTPRELAEGQFQLVIDDERGGQAAARTCGGWSVQRQGLRGPGWQRAASRSRATWPWFAWSSCIRSPPSDPAHTAAIGYPKLREVVLGPGRAREHGRVGVRAAAARGADRRPLAAALRRTGAQFEPVGRLGGVAPGEPARGGRAGLRGGRRRKVLDRVLSKQV